MVDVSAKETTRRVAYASCLIVARDAAPLERLIEGFHPVTSARLAGIQAAKRTAELIPLCHPLALSDVRIDVDEHPGGLKVRAKVVTMGRTGVEMEALTACSFAALSLLNCLVRTDPGAHLEDLVVVQKSGGKSGDWGRAVGG